MTALHVTAPRETEEIFPERLILFYEQQEQCSLEVSNGKTSNPFENWRCRDS